MSYEVEGRLPAGIWLSELRKLAESSANDNGDTEDRAVRRAFHFSQLSPLPISRIWKPLLSEADLEALLDQGKIQQAALEVIGSDTAIEISSDAAGPRSVAVVRYDDREPVSAEAATPALAMISAWAKFLSAA